MMTRVLFSTLLISLMMAEAQADGTMVFDGTVPLADWYASSRRSPFLLAYKGRRWRSFSFHEGLPGQVNAVTALGGVVYVSTNAGVFTFRP